MSSTDLYLHLPMLHCLHLLRDYNRRPALVYRGHFDVMDDLTHTRLDSVCQHPQTLRRLIKCIPRLIEAELGWQLLSRCHCTSTLRIVSIWLHFAVRTVDLVSSVFVQMDMMRRVLLLVALVRSPRTRGRGGMWLRGIQWVPTTV